MDEFALLNIHNISEEEAATFTPRTASRGVVTNDNNEVALLYAERNGLYQLPGGKMDPGETIEDCLMRECLEEIGCKVEIIAPLGKTKEYRKLRKQINISLGFLAKCREMQNDFVINGDEARMGMVIRWLPLDEAIARMEDLSKNAEIQELQPTGRDLFFLKKAQAHMLK